MLEGVERLNTNDFVFCAPASRGSTRSVLACASNLNRAFQRYRKAAGVERHMTLHGLRHGFCTVLAVAGKSAFVIRAAARHANVATSQVYVHLANEELKAELDGVFD